MYVSLLAARPAFILGLDPGYANCGWGVLANLRGRVSVVSAGTIRTDKDSGIFWHRLTTVVRIAFGEVTNCCKDAETFAVAMEGYDFYPDKTKTHQTEDKHNAVLGALWGAAISRGVEVAVYGPRESKRLICGTTAANKELVGQTVALRLNHKSRSTHEADALLIAEAHAMGREIALRTMKPPCIGEVGLSR